MTARLSRPIRRRSARSSTETSPGRRDAEWPDAVQLPVGAVLDHFGLDQVTLLGISLDGGLAIRAAAGEPRIARVICDDILTDFLACNLRQFPASAPDCCQGTAAAAGQLAGEHGAAAQDEQRPARRMGGHS